MPSISIESGSANGFAAIIGGGDKQPLQSHFLCDNNAKLDRDIQQSKSETRKKMAGASEDFHIKIYLST